MRRGPSIMIYNVCIRDSCFTYHFIFSNPLLKFIFNRRLLFMFYILFPTSAFILQVSFKLQRVWFIFCILFYVSNLLSKFRSNLIPVLHIILYFRLRRPSLIQTSNIVKQELSSYYPFLKGEYIITWEFERSKKRHDILQIFTHVITCAVDSYFRVFNMWWTVCVS